MMMMMMTTTKTTMMMMMMMMMATIRGASSMMPHTDNPDNQWLRRTSAACLRQRIQGWALCASPSPVCSDPRPLAPCCRARRIRRSRTPRAVLREREREQTRSALAWGLWPPALGRRAVGVERRRAEAGEGGVGGPEAEPAERAEGGRDGPSSTANRRDARRGGRAGADSGADPGADPSADPAVYNTYIYIYIYIYREREIER